MTKFMFYIYLRSIDRALTMCWIALVSNGFLRSWSPSKHRRLAAVAPLLLPRGQHTSHVESSPPTTNSTPHCGSSLSAAIVGITEGIPYFACRA